MSEPFSIKEPEVRDESFDLESLKEQGLKKIQELSGNNWTDFNFHDPGVTILEVLCYALTDLAYRADFDVTDLLNTAGKKKPEATFFPPEEILTTSPLSVLDFKRLILDMEGIKNCDILSSELEKVIPGIFDIKIEIHPDYDNSDFRKKISDQIRSLVEINRPPGIVIDHIGFLEYDPLGIILDLELTEDIEPQKIFTEFIQRVQNYFSPEIKFRSLQELMDKGIPMETIFNGPVLENGFLPDEEILGHSVRERVFVSDLMSLAMTILGVSFVRELRIVSDNRQEYNWIYDVKSGAVPRIDPANTKFICRYKNTIIFESKTESVELWSSPKLNRTSAHKQNTLDIATGVSRNLKKYHSIQYDFPETYGIGVKGPSAGASPEKLAAIKQLKGYLMIYDQVMANFLSQLDHVKYLFSTEDIDTSYAVQLMDDIPGIEYLYKEFIENYFVIHNDLKDKIKLRTEWVLFLKYNKDKLAAQIQDTQESQEEFLRRRNGVLDHLLARFGMDTLKLELLSEMDSSEAIAYKLDLIRKFPQLSAKKYSSGPSPFNPEISGLKHWLSKNLNLKGAHKNNITESISGKFDGGLAENDFKIEVYSYQKPLNTLLKHAAEIENIVETSENEISVYDRSNELVSRISFKDIPAGNKKELVHKKLLELDRESENFLIIDHISLKPAIDLPCYGFNILLNKTPFFISERKYSLGDCEAFLNEFLSPINKKESFSVVETSMKEYKIKFTGSYGSLLTRAYYASPAEATQQLEFFLNESKNELPGYSFSTKFEDHYLNVSNPFSYVATILIPTWPSKFQKEGFKKYMEEYLYSEFPAHIALNIKWLDFEVMKNFERDLKEFGSVSHSKDPMIRLNALDKLMNALVT